MTAIAFEESARFHRKGFVQDIAFDMAGGGPISEISDISGFLLRIRWMSSSHNHPCNPDKTQ